MAGHTSRQPVEHCNAEKRPAQKPQQGHQLRRCVCRHGACTELEWKEHQIIWFEFEIAFRK